MLRVGLTGGIGAGKSTASRQLARLGAVLVDADAIAREVVAPGTAGLAAVVEEFGLGALRPDGTFDRQRLGREVFADPDRLAALNAVVHPLVASRSATLLAAAPADAVVVYDVPLLAENDLASGFDVVVVVDAPVETQVRRLVEQRGMAESDARARIAAQASRERRRAVADVVLDNTGGPDRLAEQVDALWRRFLSDPRRSV